MKTKQSEQWPLNSLCRTSVDLLCLVLCVLLFLSSCAVSQERVFKETRFAMYTVTSITVSSSSEKKALTAIDAAFKEIEKLERLMNFYSKDSEITVINNNAGMGPVRVSPETFEVIDKAVFTAESTDGSFDVTVGPLVKLWDFQNKIVPDDKAIKERLKVVGYKNIVLDKREGSVFLRKKGMQIDLGGIVKGYSADKAVAVLKSNGIASGIVAVGGEVKAFGRKPDGTLWNIGIKNPRQKSDADEILATLRLSDKAVSTSGDYEKFFEKNGTWYHHILDPKTGYPVYRCRSATIVADDAVFTDAFATGIFVLGPQRGMEVLKRLGFEGLIVDHEGAIYTTDGLKGKINFMKEKG